VHLKFLQLCLPFSGEPLVRSGWVLFGIIDARCLSFQI